MDAKITYENAYRNGNIHPVFVYGTLMKGQRAAHMLAGSCFAGCFRLKDYAMYNLGRYPGVVPCDGETVLGELYFVSDESSTERYPRFPCAIRAYPPL